MIPKEIQALFNFIDYLDSNKNEYIKTYIPQCSNLKELNVQRNRLKPNNNYRDKQQYDIIQKEISEKIAPIKQNVFIPIMNKLFELGITNQDDDMGVNIWNRNISAITTFKENYRQEDVWQVMHYKHKYLSFRNETNTDFICLKQIFNSLDEVLKELFDFFKDTEENEFEKFEEKTIKVGSYEELGKQIIEHRNENVRFSFPLEMGLKNKNTTQANMTVKKVDENNNIAKKSFKIQKWQLVLAIIAIIVSVLIALLKYNL